MPGSPNENANRDCVGVQWIYHQASFLLVCPIFFFLYLKSKSKCLNLINWLISHNFSGYAFSSLLFIFSYLIIIMEYLELAEFSNYGTNCFRTGGTRSRARTLRIWKISREKVPSFNIMIGSTSSIAFHARSVLYFLLGFHYHINRHSSLYVGRNKCIGFRS